MTRKTFYLIITCGLLAIFIYTLLNIFFLSDLGLPRFHTSRLQDWFALSIILFEAYYAKKPFKTIIIVMLPVTIIGLLFSIMHWPFGLLLFLGSLLTIMITLIFNASKSDTNRIDKYLFLVYPFSRFILMTTTIYHLPRIWWTFDFLLMGLTAIYLSVRLARRKLDVH